mmetsp:Transcript_2658/g.3009  ORF Transcript_2658/g.3009 Transcript_2658/m.3009 type:complete len:347 (+) Transcript_2658:85-1125(+)|eukprot:CAMPEP_0197847054 /NCGR_PEP_ID=MMETSP1438-20131217/5164_1 /TAXON_ID=1461541 /ORGANISM="Pterosperma sp., Strain CCMP1384" /LENGTH=346 /DNA_ID=CAMNT_0043458865 /DNA_START=82 /DNA_END=1122 /DNA_ORIENTATION=+
MTIQNRLSVLARHLSSADERAQVDVTATSAASGLKVAVLGAAGGIGQPLSLLLKQSHLVDTLHLYDIANTPGVACDISHVASPAKVAGFKGAEELGACLQGCHLVIIPAGVPRKPGMTRDDLFNTNAGIVKTLAEGVAKHCPKAIVQVISNPVNSTVPIVAEVLKKHGVYDPARVMGVTTLDVQRANTFVAQAAGLAPGTVSVPVIGGHAGITILPLLSQATPNFNFTPEEAAKLTDRIQNGGTEVVNAKAGTGSATLSMAYAAAQFAESTMKALNGEPGVVECAYVQSNVVPGLAFFASRCLLGRNGVEVVYPPGPLNAAERAGVEKMTKELSGNISKGVAFANK